MFIDAATTGFVHVLLTILVCVFFILLELLLTALIVAPRAVITKLRSMLRGLVRPDQRTAGTSWPHGQSTRPSGEGT